MCSMCEISIDVIILKVDMSVSRENHSRFLPNPGIRNLFVNQYYPPSGALSVFSGKGKVFF